MDAYQEHLDHEFNSRYDDVAERFGWRCKRHPGTVIGGDCGLCEAWAADIEILEQLAAAGPGEFRFTPGIGVTVEDRKAVMIRLHTLGYRNVRYVSGKVVWS